MFYSFDSLQGLAEKPGLQISAHVQVNQCIMSSARTTFNVVAKELNNLDEGLAGLVWFAGLAGLVGLVGLTGFVRLMEGKCMRG